MARKPMVTRTIPSTVCKVLTVNTKDRSTKECEIIVPRTYETDAKLLDAVKQIFDAPDETPVAVLSAAVVYKNYRMSESKFIANAETVVDVESAED